MAISGIQDECFAQFETRLLDVPSSQWDLNPVPFTANVSVLFFKLMNPGSH